jgi:ribosomal protein L11 methyltransferase
MRYLRRLYTFPPAALDELVTALWEAGTLGVEEVPASPATDQATLVAWFAESAAEAPAVPPDAHLGDTSWVDAADWLAGFRAAAQPLEVGERLWLDPREPGAAAMEVPDGRLALRIPARTAFGTGSHASTRLALELIEELPLHGVAMLDVGAGSGVLSLAALALGARTAWGLDVDPAAALLAGQYTRLNSSIARFWAGSLAALSPARHFPLVVVNALPHEIAAESATIVGAVSPGGLLVVSGVPVVEEAAVLARWEAFGLVVERRRGEEEWVAWSLRRP